MADKDGGRPVADGIEVEWQFDALDLRPVERWLAALPMQHGINGQLPAPTTLAKPPRRLVDRYLDTEDWRIVRAGFVLRTRQRGRRDEVTLKDSAPSGPGGLRQRLEVTEPLPEDGLPGLGTDGPVGRRIAAVAGPRPFRQVLEVRTRRRPFSLRVAGEEVAEVALDETVITEGPAQQPVRLRRVEVEVRPEWAEDLEPVVEDLRRSCGLQPATLSKFEAGLLALGIHVPEPPDLGPTEVTPTSSLGDLAYAVIRRNLAVLLAREPGTRLGEDIEELHDMRVATRRLRAAIDFFGDILPVRARTLRAELSWLAGVLGGVRDLDVQIERLDDMERWVVTDGSDGSPLDDLRRLLTAHRVAARRVLLDALDSTRWERLAAGLTSMARTSQRGRPPAARQPAAAALPDLVTPRHRAVVKAARRAGASGIAADYHRLRIRCKRLRYSLEFTAGVYGGRTEQFTKKLARLQDALGLMQDAEVATGRLLALATSPAAGDPVDGLPPRTIFTMGAVAERYRAESHQLLGGMGRRLKLLKGREWRNLADHMSERRAAALAVAPNPPRVLEAPVDAPPSAEPPAAVAPAAVAPAAVAAAPNGDGGEQATRAAPAPPEVPAARVAPTERWAVPAVAPEVRVPELAPPAPISAALSAWPDPAWGFPAPDSGER
ncbi:MAG: CHAD domain-containing protein [Acidimicrobiales bacterium]